MTSTSKNQLNRKVYMVSSGILFLTMIVCFILGVKTKTEDIRISSVEVTELADCWRYVENNKAVTDKDISIEAGDHVLIRMNLPENLGQHEGIAYYDMGLVVSAYVDEKCFYEYGVSGNVPAGQEVGCVWRFITLSPELSEKTLILCLTNNSNNMIKFNMDKLYMGTETDLVENIRKINSFTYVIGLFCAAFVIVLSALVIGLRRADRKQYVVRILDLVLLTLCVQIWVITDSNLLQLMYRNGSVKYYLAHFAFVLMPFFLNAFYQKTLLVGQSVLETVQMVYVVILILCLLLHCLNIVHIADTLFIVHTYIFIEIMIIGHYGLTSYRRSRTISDLGLIVSFLILIAFFAVGMLQFYFSEKSVVSNTTGMGYISFVLVLGVTQILDIVRDYRLSVKAAALKKMNSVENVTQGNSRTVVYDWLKKDEIYYKGNPWFLHMDLINFASVNVSHGWEKGNEILKGIYESNLNSIGDDEIQCSIGNSNFAFVLSPERDIEELCMEISMRLEKYLAKNWDGVHLGAKYSAVRIQKNEVFESMLDHALIAYSSNKAGYSAAANCYYYNDDCRDEIKKQYTMEHQIDVGIEKKEFLMYLQPKVNPKTDQVEGAEALIRWNSSHYGMVSPGEFVPLAEKTGQIRELDLYMFKEVCQYLIKRRAKGERDIVISVNVSRYGLDNEDFFLSYRRIIEETKVPLELIDFEFTESMAYGDTAKIDRIMGDIHKDGASLSMDDFGSGYSNLASVTKLSFDVIKLDKSLIDTDFPEAKDSYVLIKHLIDLFHAMGKTIVCEGVEEEKQKDALRDLGCDLIQGFYYSRPLSVEEFEKYLEGR